MVFIPCDNWKTLFSINVCRYFEIFQPSSSSFSDRVAFLKHVFYFASTIANIKVPKQSYDILYLINFRNLFYDYIFYTLLFSDCSTFEKLKTSLETCFLHNRIFINSLVFKRQFYKARTKLQIK